MESLGYSKDTDWIEYEISMPAEPDEKIARMAAIVMKRNKFRLVELRNKKELLKHAKELFRLIENEYKQLYGTVPLTPKQVDAYIAQYFGFVTPDFVPMVYNEKNEMVAFGIALPSLSRAIAKKPRAAFPLRLHLLVECPQEERPRRPVPGGSQIRIPRIGCQCHPDEQPV